MPKPKSRAIAIRCVLALVLAPACSSKTPVPSRVFVLNGLDIPVVVTIESPGGNVRLELEPRSRARPQVSGMARVKVTTPSGALISESEAQLGKPTGCLRVYNVMGAAAYVHEEVQYGTGFGPATTHRRAGEITEEECGVSFPFVDPAQAISVKQMGPAGDNRGWLHDQGDGGWVVAVTSLLDDTSRWADQSRAKAQRIVRAVVTHDPSNPALPAVAARLAKTQLAMPAATPGNLLASPPARKPRSSAPTGSGG